MEKRERSTGSRRPKDRRREPEKGPSLAAWLRCYAPDEQTAVDALRRAQEAREVAQEGHSVRTAGQRK